MKTTDDYIRNQRIQRQTAVEAILTQYPDDWTPVQAHIIGLAVDNECPVIWFSQAEYQPLIDAGILQNNNGWLIVKPAESRAVSTEAFEPLDCERTATLAADWMIDERMDKLGMHRGE